MLSPVASLQPSFQSNTPIVMPQSHLNALMGGGLSDVDMALQGTNNLVALSQQVVPQIQQASQLYQAQQQQNQALQQQLLQQQQYSQQLQQQLLQLQQQRQQPAVQPQPTTSTVTDSSKTAPTTLSTKETTATSSVNGKSNEKVSFKHPLAGKGEVTSGFGPREHPTKGGTRMHNGIDLGAPSGTPIVAAAAGKVTVVGWDEGGYGHWVEIKHTNGTTTRYGHLKDKSPLSEGATVTQGQKIGEVGSTGASTGPHLHFEIREEDGKKPVDPKNHIQLA
ncbi:MAG: M23 family metallopeptidase [Vampirovibrionales bacterium]